MSYDPFVGEIKIFGFNFAPEYHAICAGQLMSIAQYTALFSLLGTTYGGNGQTTFGLPNLQGRIPVGFGANPATGRVYIQGEQGGNVSATLLTSNLPAHTHPATGISINVPVSEGGADTDSPVNAFLANTGSGLYANTTDGLLGPLTASGTIAPTGSSLPVEIENPYLTINYSIALQGMFPSRN